MNKFLLVEKYKKMDASLIGRKEEKEILLEALSSPESEMVAVIGRRRVGKTFLVRTIYADRIVFEITGLQDASRKQQLENFVLQLAEASGAALPIRPPASWLEAFALLITYLKTLNLQEKPVVFLDELPWLATHKSGFLHGLSYFWNSWAVKQHIVVVVCGSAASWMIQKVVNNRGGLYNRITKRIFLEPFTLSETEAYLQSRNMHFDHYQIVQLYMATGGIPHYLKEIKGGKSAVQNINQICFSRAGLLRSEFLRLYPSLFANAERHMAVIRALAAKRHGLTSKEITQLSGIPEGGSTSRVLEELLHSGFIAAYRPFGRKKREKVYRLVDEYSLFYLSFIEGNEEEGPDTWYQLSQTQTYKTWSGYTFESICLKHIPQIKKAMGISGIYSTSSFFYKKGTAGEPGAQIDLLIDRKDQVINIFEIKYHNEPFTVSKAYAENLRNKLSVFREATRTRKQLFLILIATFGLKENQHSLGLIAQSLSIEDLFGGGSGVSFS